MAGLPGWLPQGTVGSLGWLPEAVGQRRALSHGLAIVRVWPPSLTDYPTHAPRSGPTPVSA